MERKEDSVLHSLNELRSIEENRIKAEQEVERKRVEDERRAAEDTARKAKEDAERKEREERERQERAAAEKERQIREEQMNLEASERKARIDAHAQIEAARVQAEIHAKAHAKKFPIGLVIGGVVVLLALAGSLFYVINVYMPEQAAKAEHKAKISQEKAIAAAIERERKALEEDYKEKVAQAKTEAEREKLRRDRDAAQQASEARIRARGGHASPSTSGTTKPARTVAKCDPEKDPLCGADIK